jgi:hypothetical protein
VARQIYGNKVLPSLERSGGQEYSFGHAFGLPYHKLRFVLTIRKASAELVLLSGFMISEGVSGSANHHKGIKVLPSSQSTL